MMPTTTTLPCSTCGQPLPRRVYEAAGAIYGWWHVDLRGVERRIADRLERGPMISEAEAEDELWEFLGFSGTDLVAAVQHYRRECGR